MGHGLSFFGCSDGLYPAGESPGWTLDSSALYDAVNSNN